MKVAPHFLFPSLLVAAVAVSSTLACQPSKSERVGSSDSPIVGGQEASPGEWAGMAALFSSGMQICGGALVAPNWVVTAAHCITPGAANGDIDAVVVGRHNLTTSEGESLTVKRAIRHAGFNRGTMDNDIALLELNSSATSPVAKMITRAQIAELTDTSKVTVTGWGNTSEWGSSSDVLLEVEVNVISTSQCQTFSSYEDVNENQICAGFVNGAKDSCQGDSGGPLFFKVGNEVLHVGIVSWGIGCARPNAPGVYTRTSRYLGWMFDQTAGAAGEAEGSTTDAGTDSGTGEDGGQAFLPFQESGTVAENEEKSFEYAAPAGTYDIVLTGTNDADLYVQTNGPATTADYACASEAYDSSEHCTVTLSGPGTLHVMVFGYSDVPSDFTLTGSKH